MLDFSGGIGSKGRNEHFLKAYSYLVLTNALDVSIISSPMSENVCPRESKRLAEYHTRLANDECEF